MLTEVHKIIKISKLGKKIRSNKSIKFVAIFLKIIIFVIKDGNIFKIKKLLKNTK